MKNNTVILLSLAVAAGAAVFLLTRPSKAEPSPLPGPKPQPQPLPSGGGTVTTLPEVVVTASGANPPPAWKGPLPPSPEDFRTGLTTLWVQKFLTALAKIENNVDFDPRTMAGVWDGPTAQAVMVYQIDRRLGVDGKVGPITAGAMKADYLKYTSKPPTTSV